MGIKPESMEVSRTVNDSIPSTILSFAIDTIPYCVAPLASPSLKITVEPATFEKSAGDSAESSSVKNSGGH